MATVITNTSSGTTLSIGQVHWCETQINFGDTPAHTAQFTVYDSNVTATSRVAVIACALVPDGKELDDAECDQLMLSAGEATAGAAGAPGTFTLFARGTQGSVSGYYKVLYVVITGAQ